MPFIFWIMIIILSPIFSVYVPCSQPIRHKQKTYTRFTHKNVRSLHIFLITFFDKASMKISCHRWMSCVHFTPILTLFIFVWTSLVLSGRNLGRIQGMNVIYFCIFSPSNFPSNLPNTYPLPITLFNGITDKNSHLRVNASCRAFARVASGSCDWDVSSKSIWIKLMNKKREINDNIYKNLSLWTIRLIPAFRIPFKIRLPWRASCGQLLKASLQSLLIA